MSAESTPVSAAHLRYVAERTRREDSFLTSLREAAREAGIPPIWISPEQGSCMQILLKLARAKEVLEVGTLAGYSAVWMARALPPDGRVLTVEVDPARAAFARRWAARSDVGARVQVVVADARVALPAMAASSFDAAFLDADKASYGAYLDECLRLVRPGGMILVDNAFAFGHLLDPAVADADVDAVRAFNDRMAAESSLQAVILPIGDGLWVGVRR